MTKHNSDEQLENLNRRHTIRCTLGNQSFPRQIHNEASAQMEFFVVAMFPRIYFHYLRWSLKLPGKHHADAVCSMIVKTTKLNLTVSRCGRTIIRIQFVYSTVYNAAGTVSPFENLCRLNCTCESTEKSSIACQGEPTEAMDASLTQLRSRKNWTKNKNVHH